MRIAFTTILCALVLSLAPSELRAREVVKVTKNGKIESQVTRSGVEYIIQSKFDLNGNSLTVPPDCAIRFEKKGRLQNGTLVGNNTEIYSKKNKVLRNISIKGTYRINRALPEWFVGDDATKIRNAILIADTVAINNNYRCSQTISIDKPIVLEGSGQITWNDNLLVGLYITSSDVALSGIMLKTNSIKSDLIQAIGTHNLPLKSNKIERCAFYGGMNSIRWDYVDDAIISHCYFQDVDYAAVGVHSCHNVDVSYNHIHNINLNHNNKNSYGVAATFHYGHPKSKDIRITDNIVENNPYWEALDTHGGENIEFRRNIVRNCWRGVAAVSDNHRESVLCSNITITDNDIECSPEPYSNGIVFTGLSDDSLAIAWSISGNVIKNAVIGLYSNYTSGADVKNNEVTAVDEGWRDRGSVGLLFESNMIRVVGVGSSQYKRCGLFLIPSKVNINPFGEIKNNHIITNDNEGVIARDAFNSSISLVNNVIETKGVKYKGGDDSQSRTLRLHYFTEIKE